MSFIAVKNKGLFITKPHITDQTLSEYFPRGGEIQTEKDEELIERLTIQRNPNNDSWSILGEGGYGTAFKATLLIDVKQNKRIPCVVKIPSFLINREYIQISSEGRLVKKGNINPNDERLVLFTKEIENLTKLRKGNAFVDAGIIKPGRTIRNSVFVNALREARELPITHKGHEYIHRLLECNTGSIPCLVSEFCNGNLLDLHNLLALSTNFFLSNINHWMRTAVYEIYQGISYMHSMNISHNDIKPDNIFFIFQSRYQITYKISDFGLCSDNTPLEIARGTELYLSPELKQMRNNPDGGLKSLPFSNDAYAVGLTCLEMLFMSKWVDSDISKSFNDVENYIHKYSTDQTEYQNEFNSFCENLRRNWDICSVENFVKMHNDLLSLCVLPEDQRLNVFDNKLPRNWVSPPSRHSYSLSTKQSQYSWGPADFYPRINTTI